MERYASGTAYAGAGVATVFGLTLPDFGALVGIALAVATFGLNWWYKHRALRLLASKPVVVVEDAIE